LCVKQERLWVVIRLDINEPIFYVLFRIDISEKIQVVYPEVILNESRIDMQAKNLEF